MNIYSIDNKKYNVNFDLKLYSFHDFFELLKESKKYYHDYCNLKNINIKDFDNEYIININKLEGELFKYFILLTDDNNVEKYVIINDTIKDIYNSTIEIFTNMNLHNTNGYIYFYRIIIQSSFNINYLTRQKIDILIKIFTHFALQILIQKILKIYYNK